MPNRYSNEADNAAVFPEDVEDTRQSRSTGRAADVNRHHEDVDEQQPPTFAQLGVPGPLVSVLARDGKTRAFPIQADTLEDSLAGRDILGRGETGSGKTLAFTIPLVARLSGEMGTFDELDAAEDGREDDFDVERDARGNRSAHTQARDQRRVNGRVPAPRAMVLAPTRELVNQIDEVITPLAAAYRMSTATIYGGVKYSRQIAQLRAGADIIVACPGRLEDLLKQGELTLDSVEVSVLDEADEMADMGFLPAVSRLLEQVRPNGQRMLFSATLDHGVDKVVKRFLHHAKVHEVDSATSQVDTMTHHVFEVSQGNKYEVIRELASGLGKRILFTRTKYQAKNMAAKLVKEGIPAVDLQGNLSQNQRDRHLAAFTSGEVRVLVATDVAARGIDVSDVTLVVQTEPPEDPKSFLHRSGRTARAGESGDVVTLVLPQQRRDARQMLHRAGIKAKSHEIVPGAAELEKLVGEHAPLVEGWTLTVPVVNKKAGRTGRGGRNRNASRGANGRRGEGRRDGRSMRESREGRDGRNRDEYRGERRSRDRFDDNQPFEGRSNRKDQRDRRERSGYQDRGGHGGRRSEGFEERGGSRRGRESGRDRRYDGGRDGGNPRYGERSGRDNGGRSSGRSRSNGDGSRQANGFRKGKGKGKRNSTPFRRAR